MATLWNLVLVVSLLALSAPQRCSGVDHDSLDLRELKFLAAMHVMNEALECIGDTVKEGFQLYEKNSAELVLMVKEQTNKQNENIDSLKKTLTALQSGDAVSQENEELKHQLENKDKVVDGLSQEIVRLKYQLENKDKMVKAVTEEVEDLKQQLQNNDERVRHLEESVAECQQLVSDHTNTEKLLSNKVQVLEKRIMEHQLEDTLVQLNNTVAARKNDTDSCLKWTLNGQKVIRLVQQYSNTKDWETLKKGLEAVLDHNSEPYSQLQHVEYSNSYPLANVGYYGRTRLVSLLLDAGMPVDTSDADGNTMLHGAAAGGHLQLVKLLLHRGSSVNVRNKNARTSLMHAALSGHLEVVQYLVSAGADTTATDNSGLTALNFSTSGDHPAVVQYLQQLPR